MSYLFQSRFPLLVFLFALAFGGTGCRENTLINSKVSPAINTVNQYTDSIFCITKTYYDDTAITSTTLPSVPIYQGIGNLSDAFFGTMTGSTYFQVIPLNKGFGAYDSMTVDSAFIVVPYGGFIFGDATAGKYQSYQAFYTTEPMYYDSVYHSYDSKTFDATFPLSDPTTVDISSWDLLADTVTQAKNYPGLRLKLKVPVLMNYLRHADSALINSTSVDADFIKAFNGICIRPANTTVTSPAYPYFRLDGSNIYTQAGLLVYTHKTSKTDDTAHLVTYYYSTNNCAHFNSIRKTYSHSPVSSLYANTTPNDHIIAVQNQPGAALDIVLPGLKKFPDGVLNKAELQFTVLSDATYGNYLTSGTFLGPERMFPTGIGNGVFPTGIGYGLTYILSDYYPLTSLSAFGVLDGYVHNVNGRRVYTINIPREVLTSIKAGNDTLHLHINGTQDYYGAGHTVLAGGGYPDALYRPKLFVVYSKLN